MNLICTLDEHLSDGRQFVILESKTYFMTIDEGNIFKIFEFNEISEGINVNKYIGTYHSAIMAFSEFRELIKKETS